jgi:hypothetical protein
MDKHLKSGRRRNNGGTLLAYIVKHAFLVCKSAIKLLSLFLACLRIFLKVFYYFDDQIITGRNISMIFSIL